MENEYLRRKKRKEKGENWEEREEKGRKEGERVKVCEGGPHVWTQKKSGASTRDFDSFIIVLPIVLQKQCA